MTALPSFDKAASGQEAQANGERVLEAYEAFLHALMHHMDDCLSLLRGFVPHESVFKKSSAVRQYQKGVDDYRNRIGLIVNRIKHQQRRLNLVTARLGMYSWEGYFVEQGLPTGGVGPDREIHKTCDVFSFNCDLRYHICQLVLTSEHLAVAVRGLTRGAEDVGSASTRQPLAESVAKISRLPQFYFHDEYELPQPVLRFEDTPSGTRQLVVGLAKSKWRPFAGKTYQVSVRLRGDGVTRSWGLPTKPSRPIGVPTRSR